MTTKRLSPSLTDVVPERDARAVRGYANRLESLGHSDRNIGTLTSTARHVAVWLAASGLGLETFDIRLVDRFMRHVCHCPGRHRIGKRPGPDQRYFAIGFLRHLLEDRAREGARRRSRPEDISPCSSGSSWKCRDTRVR